MAQAGASATTITGTGHEDRADHSCHKMIRLLKETLNYHTGDHHTFFVFGATLDIALKKIYPTLWALYRDELMPKKTAIVGYARSTLTVAQFRVHISKYIKLKDANEEQLFDQFLQHNVYVQGKYNEHEDFKRLVKTVEMLEQSVDDGDAVANNRLFYLALPPSVFEPVTKLISEFVTSKSGWNRVIIEKPFRNDTDSSETLSRHLLSLYKEEELYRIDHYLNIEMIQNLMVLRSGVKFMTKSPGMTFRLEETEIDLTCPSQYKDSHLPGAYERTIVDVFAGSQMNFVRSDELAEAWRIFTPLLHDIEGKKIAPLPYLYSSRGPKQADDFCTKYGFKLAQALDSKHLHALDGINNAAIEEAKVEQARRQAKVERIRAELARAIAEQELWDAALAAIDAATEAIDEEIADLLAAIEALD